MEWNDENLIRMLNRGGVAVMPTDTIYGIVCGAFDRYAVNNVYEIRQRAPDKPCVILIGEIDQLKKFSIELSPEQKERLEEFWPGPVSVILDCDNEAFSYLHRGTKTLAFRLSASESLRNLLIKTGPLIAPSANPEGLSPAQNIAEAKKYFGESVDFYLDGGEISGKASKVIKLHNDGSVHILRE